MNRRHADVFHWNLGSKNLFLFYLISTEYLIHCLRPVMSQYMHKRHSGWMPPHNLNITTSADAHSYCAVVTNVHLFSVPKPLFLSLSFLLSCYTSELFINECTFMQYT